ncbi:MocR-like pyridoxine biosynthesis transcription factor PdxR [Carnimonas bestiolae]|uniref:MocR-like pyridoxine biosynthesis transcription factor PdxR n=1 Tax=Carnimonas bestiolae TaxID=3402172 RepID=UPI003EDBB8EC
MYELWIDLLQLTLPERTERCLNERLYGAIRDAILNRTFNAGARLPASRELAAGLGISRNTVTRVFDQLMIEGFVETQIGSGTYVADVQGSVEKSATSVNGISAAPLRLSERGAALASHSSAAVKQWGAFMPGVPDVRLFPHARLQKRVARVLHAASPGVLSYPEQAGSPVLREALVKHLRVARGLQCDPSQIVIVEGAHQGIDLIIRLLADVGDSAWLEEPGYWGIRRLLEINGVQAHPVPVDDEGITLPKQSTPPPRLIFTTPSHHYPLGAVMSIQRRRQLLAYARQHQAIIIEDDYDSEFRYTGSPVPALSGLEADAPVIYVGTFSKTICPNLRVAYMVLPQALSDYFQRAYLDVYRGGHTATQQALGEFIESGEYAQHIRRMRGVYGRRRDALSGLVEARFGSQLLSKEASDSAGLHLTLRLPPFIDDADLARAVAQQGVLTRPLSRYYLGQSLSRGLLLGYACVSEDEMIQPFDALAECVAKVL